MISNGFKPRCLRKDHRLRIDCHRQGVVLFIVVAIVLMITLLTYGFLISMRTQNLAAAQAGDRLLARQAAFSARELVCALLETPLSQRFEAGGLVSNPQLFREIQLIKQDSADEELSSVGFVVSDRNAARFGIENQAAKIDLGRLLIHEADNPEWGRNCLMQLPNMTETMADRILDWIDPDDEPREFGAEVDFYLETIGRPPRNGIPPSLEEFAAIPEISLELIRGRDGTNQNQEQTNSVGAEAQAGDGTAGWDRFLTVRTAERNEDFDGRSRINLNDSNLFELHTQLAESIDVEMANFIVLARQYGLTSSSIGLSGAGSGSRNMRTASEIQIDFTVSPSFSFESRIDIWNGLIPMGDEEDPESQTWVQSPWQGENTTLDDRLEKLMDVTTTIESPTLPGAGQYPTSPPGGPDVGPGDRFRPGRANHLQPRRPK